MKVTIDKNAPKPSDDELEAMSEAATPTTDEDAREIGAQVNEIVFPQYVVEQLEAMGLTVDDVAAQMAALLGKQH